MADKDLDRPENKTLSSKLRKAAQAATHENAPTRMFGQELKSRMTWRSALIYPAAGTLIVANIGAMGGMIAYDVADQARPTESYDWPFFGCGTCEAFQAVRAGGGEYLIISDTYRDANGEKTVSYGLYTHAGGDREFHYVQDASAALGHLYRIASNVKEQKDALAAGKWLPSAEQVEFYTPQELSVLHQEEKGSFERSYDELTPAVQAGLHYNEYLDTFDGVVQQAIQNILVRNQYGDPTFQQARQQDRYDSPGDYAREGAAAAAALALAAAAGIPLAGAGLATRRRKGKKPA